MREKERKTKTLISISIGVRLEKQQSSALDRKIPSFAQSYKYSENSKYKFFCRLLLSHSHTYV